MKRQFQVREILWVVATASIYLAISQSAGYGVSAGIVSCLLLMAWAWRTPLQGHLFLAARSGAVLLALVSIWFLAVDIYVQFDYCPTCSTSHKYVDHRVLGIPVRRSKVNGTTSIELILADLGNPCLHPQKETVPLQRLWGLCLVACPDFRGTIGMSHSSDLEWYTETLRERVRQAGKDDPQLGERMQHRFETGRYEEFWAEIRRITVDQESP